MVSLSFSLIPQIIEGPKGQIIKQSEFRLPKLNLAFLWVGCYGAKVVQMYKCSTIEICFEIDRKDGNSGVHLNMHVPLDTSKL